MQVRPPFDPNELAESTCIICRTRLRPLGTAEHVIPNAIGGRLIVRGFICASCNSNSGSSWDAALAAQLNPLSLLIGIVRERGRPPPIVVSTTAGERLRLDHEGQLSLSAPTYLETSTPEGKRLTITARTQREARQILTGAKRKYPKLDVEKMLSEARIERIRPQGMIQQSFQVGGPDAGRSIVKTALAFAHLSGLTLSEGEALDYLRDPTAEPSFGYYYKTDLLIDRPPSVPLHCVAVSADPETGLVLGYVEYFGIHRIVVCLGRAYAGSARRAAHAINPRDGCKVEVEVQMNFKNEDITALYDYGMAASDEIIAIYDAILGDAVVRNARRTRDRVLHEAFDYGWANCGACEGEYLSEEHIKRLTALFVEGIKPLITGRRSI